MSLYDKASLVLIPSGTKAGTVYSQKPTSGDGDFDFTRSTYATRVNSQGLIEKERSNLLTHSNNFSDSDWVQISTTRTGGQLGYDGSNDAWELVRSSGGTLILNQSQSLSGVYTFSCYVKINAISGFGIGFGGSNYGLFNISDSSQTSVVLSSNLVDSSIQYVGNNFYRISVTANGSFSEVRFILASADGTSTSILGGTHIVQDAQLEQGLVATDYIETTTSAVYTGITDNVPRLDYDGDCPSLLLEPSRTNEVEYSEYMEASIWQKQSGVTVVSNTSDTTSPEGKYNANKITSTDGATGVYINTFSKTTDIVRTVYMKGENGGESITIKDGSGSGGQTNVALTTEWVRYEHKTTSDGNNYQGMFLDDIPTTSAIYVYGAQIEEGSYATSYIPTYGITITRAAETANNCGAAQDFNDDEGVLFVEIAALANDGSNRRISLSDGTTSNEIVLGYHNASNEIRFFSTNNGIVYSSNNLINNVLEFNRVAFKYKQNDFSVWINGEKIDESNIGNVSSGLNQIRFEEGDGSNDFYGKVKELKVYTETLNDAELRLLTKYAPKDYDAAFTADYVDSLAEFTVLRTEATDKLYYSISDGTNSVSGSATITATQVTISNIDISSLTDGTLTLSVYIEDERKQRGVTVTDTTIKDTTNTPLYSYALQQRATGATFEDLDNSESIIESLNVEV